MSWVRPPINLKNRHRWVKAWHNFCSRCRTKKQQQQQNVVTSEFVVVGMLPKAENVRVIFITYRLFNNLGFYSLLVFCNKTLIGVKIRDRHPADAHLCRII